MIELLDEKVAAAFAGDVNLHDFETQIDSLADIYERLRAEASDNKLVVEVRHRESAEAQRVSRNTKSAIDNGKSVLRLVPPQGFEPRTNRL
jgi:hypothetical protein